nr:MAG TPA: hypothetical protein [Caudoviricetes sp.]
MTGVFLCHIMASLSTKQGKTVGLDGPAKTG